MTDKEWYVLCREIRFIGSAYMSQSVYKTKQGQLFQAQVHITWPTTEECPLQLQHNADKAI